MDSPREHVNIHGRRWGRGLRPYLLLPKVLCVGVFFGGVVTLLVLAFAGPRPGSAAEWLAQAGLLRRTYLQVVIPGLLGAMLFGFLLLLSAWWALLRMRWMQVKLVAILLSVPALHLYMRSRSLQLQEAVRDSDFARAEGLYRSLAAGTLAVAVFAMLVISLGRIKPRLGQAYGRTFGRGVGHWL